MFKWNNRIAIHNQQMQKEKWHITTLYWIINVCLQEFIKNSCFKAIIPEYKLIFHRNIIKSIFTL